MGRSAGLRCMLVTALLVTIVASGCETSRARPTASPTRPDSAPGYHETSAPLMATVPSIAPPPLMRLTATATWLPAGHSNRGWTPTETWEGDVALVYVPGGCFLMGSANGEEDEQPVHEVCINPFWIGRTEVTNAQYAACVEADACEPPLHQRFYQNRDYADDPVVYVTWHQAVAYAEWLSSVSGRPFRLPSEAEWEYAARGPEGWDYPSWKGGAERCQAAEALVCEDDLPNTPSQSSAPPPLLSGPSWVGASDMVNGPWEWVADYYAPDYYSTFSDDAVDPQGPESGRSRVIRGGSSSFSSGIGRTTFRAHLSPHSGVYYVGFRVAAGAPAGRGIAP